MRIRHRLAGAGLVAGLLLPLLACFGNGRPAATAGGAFLAQVSPGSLSIPAGGGGYVSVTTARALPHFPNLQGPLTLSLDQAPAGVTGSGTIPADRATGTLSLWVDASVSPQALQGLRVKVTAPGLATVATFDLTVTAPLPPGQLRADLVQASGQAQQGGTYANTPVVQEPVAARPASDAAQVQTLRHGFHPAAPAN
ncbi:hypothetical protein [Geothrix paludis]|uniref:hypothetical protein n=1 Tax=Geothrix paludis TaxID=2922722 RepID=UPI001FAD5960|nr:hypothetical protein [Geothrix paludis]